MESQKLNKTTGFLIQLGLLTSLSFYRDRTG